MPGPGAGNTRWTRAAVAVVAALWLTCTAADAGPKAVESELKAVFLYKLVQFVEWPDSAFVADDKFVIGVLGEDPIEDALRVVTKNKIVLDRTPVVRRLTSVRQVAGCHVLYVAPEFEEGVCDIVRDLPSRHVLTIGGFEDFCSFGGLMALTVKDNHVSFAINRDSYDRSGISMSARLLRLAIPLGGERCQ